MQGYNELLTPIYYVFYQAREFFDDDFQLLEPLIYYCFQNLLTETHLHELYQTEDKSSTIMHNLDLFSLKIAKHLPQVYAFLKRSDAHPLFYCYRWFNLLFSQEYDMPNILHIWDALFCNYSDLVNYAFYIGLSHLNLAADEIINKPPDKLLSFLQKISVEVDIDFKVLLMTAKDFWVQDQSPNLEKDDSKPMVFVKNFFKKFHK